jgi:hypothetical protein
MGHVEIIERCAGNEQDFFAPLRRRGGDFASQLNKFSWRGLIGQPVIG